MNTSLPDLQQQAIHEALNGNWDEASQINQEILQQEPNNIQALNRLSKCYEKLGNIDKAIKTLKKVLNLDSFNSIALNNLDRFKNIDIKGIQLGKSPDILPHFDFIEEPGKTKTVKLTKTAPKNILVSLEPSQKVKLKKLARRVVVSTLKGIYIGSLPDDLSVYLIKLLSYGYDYEAVLKSIYQNEIELFIRETKRSKKLKGLPSFPSKDIKTYYDLLPTDPIAEVPLEISDTDIQEE